MIIIVIPITINYDLVVFNIWLLSYSTLFSLSAKEYSVYSILYHTYVHMHIYSKMALYLCTNRVK